MNATALQHVFQPPPPRWGLRGDPYLWQDLEQALAAQPQPGSPAAVDALLARLYLALVGENPSAGHRTYVPRYAHGGLSSGYVDADFWLTQGLPLLRQRLLGLLG
jgi:molybdenum cofactor cytidylyltransferase